MENLEKFKSLASNDAFLEKLISAKDDEEIKECFKEQGVEISDKELETFKEEFKKRASNEVGKLSDEGLEEIAGGSNVRESTVDGMKYGVGIGTGFGALAGTVIGIMHAVDHDTTGWSERFWGSEERNIKSTTKGAKIFFKDFLKYTAAGAIAGTGIGAGIGAASSKLNEWKNQK